MTFRRFFSSFSILILALIVTTFDTISCSPSVEKSKDNLSADTLPPVSGLGNTVGSTDLPVDDELAYPNQKSKEQLTRLQSSWDAALASERKLLVSTRLDEWMKGLKITEDQDGMPVPGKLTVSQFAALGVEEQLGYEMFHPEDWSQNCSEYAAMAGSVLAISRWLPFDESGNSWSERQMNALRKDSNAVKKIILKSIVSNKAVSIAMMRNVSEFKVYDAILPLIEIYQSQTTKDDLILSTLVELMEKGTYWEWLHSEPCKALVIDPYGNIPLTIENSEQIIGFAKKFATKLNSEK